MNMRVLCSIACIVFLHSLFCFSQVRSYPIDVVYTWVDGNDPYWLVQKEYCLLQELSKKNISQQECRILHSEYRNLLRKRSFAADSVTNNRFSNHDELRYSLRSLYMYAPFVRHIYIVTMNQCPAWFVPHPKVTFINHADIFKNSADLPTFNSHAIESNLHRISDLAEHFLYFNDDVFLGAPVTAHDFFTDDGKVVVLFEKGFTVSQSAAVNASAYRKAWRNTNAYLDAHYKNEKRRRLSHAPFALRKSYVEFSEQEFPFIFASNSSHKFRSDADYNLTNGLLQYHWFYHDLIMREWGFKKNRMVTLGPDAMIDKTKRELAQLYQDLLQSFCLQDAMDTDSHIMRTILHDFLESYYPVKAPWEK